MRVVKIGQPDGSYILEDLSDVDAVLTVLEDLIYGVNKVESFTVETTEMSEAEFNALDDI